MSYIFGSNFQTFDVLSDGFWPPGEKLGQCWRDQVRIESFWILRFPQQTDDHADDEAEHAGDGRVPHVRDLVDFEVGEALAVKKNHNLLFV